MEIIVVCIRMVLVGKAESGWIWEIVGKIGKIWFLNVEDEGIKDLRMIFRFLVCESG